MNKNTKLYITIMFSCLFFNNVRASQENNLQETNNDVSLQVKQTYYISISPNLANFQNNVAEKLGALLEARFIGVTVAHKDGEKEIPEIFFPIPFALKL